MDNYDDGTLGEGSYPPVLLPDVSPSQSLLGMSMRDFLAMVADFGIMAGESWQKWRVVLIATVGEPLTEPEMEIFREFAGRDPPTEHISLLATFVGRRGGKDSAIAVLVCYLALCIEWTLSLGEIGTIMAIAVNRKQAKISFRRIIGVLRAVPVLEAKIANVTSTEVMLENDVEITVTTADAASVRGATVVAAVLDEAAFMTDETFDELIVSITPALGTMPRSLIAVITTIYSSQGKAYELFRQWGESIAGQLVIKGTTRDFNVTYSQKTIDIELAKDPQRARAEYLSIPRTDVSRLFDAALLDAVTRNEYRELPFRQIIHGGKTRYSAGVDVSGGRGDAASCAISHPEGERVVIDAVRAWPAPHDPVVVAGEIAVFMGLYGLKTAIADDYAAEFSRSVYREAGIELQSAHITRSEAYMHALPLFTTNRVEIPDHPGLRQELLALERRTGRSGKDSVDHPPHGHDDIANATSLAAYASRPVASGSRGAACGVQSTAMEAF